MDRTSILFITILVLLLATIGYGYFYNKELAESVAKLAAILAVPFIAYRIQRRYKIIKKRRVASSNDE